MDGQDEVMVSFGIFLELSAWCRRNTLLQCLCRAWTYEGRNFVFLYTAATSTKIIFLQGQSLYNFESSAQGQRK